jgi:hypothetical protein
MDVGRGNNYTSWGCLRMFRSKDGGNFVTAHMLNLHCKQINRGAWKDWFLQLENHG